MWFTQHCLPWGSACQPASWVDLAELFAGIFVLVALVMGFFLGLWALGEWLG